MTNQQNATDCSVSSSEQAGSSWKDRMGNWRVYATAAGATLDMSANAQADALFTGPIDATVFGNNDGTGRVFLGFELLTGVAADDLGWIHVAKGDRLAVDGWVYRDLAGQPIYVGQTIASHSEVPEPHTASLALLASGFAGILAWRKLRAARSAHIGAVLPDATG